MPLPRAPLGRAISCAVACHIYVSNSHIKFGWISTYGLGGDRVMDRWMEGQLDEHTYLLAPPQGPNRRDKNYAVDYPMHMSNSHTKFGQIPLNGLGEDSMDVERTDGRIGRCDFNFPISFIKKRGLIYKKSSHIIY